MIRPDQIPDEVVDVLWSSTGEEPVGVLAVREEAKRHLAAALSAWPGEAVGFTSTWWGQKFLMLPLPAEASDD